MKRLSSELTDVWIQLSVGIELHIPVNEIKAINSDNPEIKMDSFEMLKYWYDRQVYKVEALSTLCDALTRAGQSGLIEKILKTHCQQF